MQIVVKDHLESLKKSLVTIHSSLYSINDVNWHHLIYCKHAIIRRGFYIFCPIFQCGFKSRAVNITDNLWTKQGYVILKSVVKNGFKSRVDYSGVYNVLKNISLLLQFLKLRLEFEIPFELVFSSKSQKINSFLKRR